MSGLRSSRPRSARLRRKRPAEGSRGPALRQLTRDFSRTRGRSSLSGAFAFRQTSSGRLAFCSLFKTSRRIELDDGRTLAVMYQGERYGWGAYIPKETRRPASADTPALAASAYLDVPVESLPLAVRELGDQMEQELSAAPRYVCDCCGFQTLLNTGQYEICAVCRWEDDRADNARIREGPEAPSGPNHITLTEARENFQKFGAAKERSRHLAREPRPEEHQAQE